MKYENLIKKLYESKESIRFETKRVSGKMVHKALETVVAFANTAGGLLVLGMEDYKKAKGKDRLIGIHENPEAVDELRRKIRQQITPPIERINWSSLPCICRDGESDKLVIRRTKNHKYFKQQNQGLDQRSDTTKGHGGNTESV